MRFRNNPINFSPSLLYAFTLKYFMVNAVLSLIILKLICAAPAPVSPAAPEPPPPPQTPQEGWIRLLLPNGKILVSDCSKCAKRNVKYVQHLAVVVCNRNCYDDV